MKKSEVWLVRFPGAPEPGEPAHARPALIVSADRANESGGPTVVVVPLTTSNRAYPTHVEIDVAWLDDVSYAQSELATAVSKLRLVHRLGRAPIEAATAGDDKLRSVLGL